MSSYFDSAEWMFQRAMQAGDEEGAARVARTAFGRYARYIDYVRAHLYADERERFAPFLARFEALAARPLVDDFARSSHMSWPLSNLHDFAHAFATARFRMRGRVGAALDNPYWPGSPRDEIDSWRPPR